MDGKEGGITSQETRITGEEGSDVWWVNYPLSAIPCILPFVPLFSLLWRNQQKFEWDHFLLVYSWWKAVDTSGWVTSMYIQTPWSSPVSLQLVGYGRAIFEEEPNMWRSLLTREGYFFPTTGPPGSVWRSACPPSSSAVILTHESQHK